VLDLASEPKPPVGMGLSPQYAFSDF